MAIAGDHEQTGCYSGREVRLTGNLGPGHKAPPLCVFLVAASHDSFATGLRSGRPIFVLPLLRENKTPGYPIQRVLENDFVVVTGTGTARDFIRLLTIELHWKDKEKTGLPGLPIKGLVKIAK